MIRQTKNREETDLTPDEARRVRLELRKVIAKMEAHKHALSYHAAYKQAVLFIKECMPD